MGITKTTKSPLLSPPKAITNYCSDGTQAGALVSGIRGNLKSALSGALDANVYKAVLTVSGGGVIAFCAATTEDTTSRTVGLKITIDGTDVFSAITPATTTQYDGLVGIGVASNAIGAGIPAPIYCLPFESSLSVSVRSSVSETDKVRLYYLYWTV